ncbi:MAG: Gfo/Idh/MocA family oxidoreductase [bacterium]|nr:Gfo/Idh/MocA family oxidoreductase [bacterium]
MKNFAVIGTAGYIAPRHLKAIQDTGNRLVAAVDPHDSVGLLDRYSRDARFFTEIERFDRFVEKLRHSDDERKLDYVSICSPNYLHDAHCRLALRIGASAICEKPLVINPWNLDQLQQIEHDTGGRVHTVLQLRLHPHLIALKKELDAKRTNTKHNVELTYITPRGRWYLSSWKGMQDKSGGLATNIGIHLFDLLMWLFGAEESCKLHYSSPQKMAGTVEFKNANVTWFLSVDANDLPTEQDRIANKAYRSILIDGEAVEFSEGFTDLHTRVYEDIMSTGGFGIEDARSSIELVYHLRQQTATPSPDCHPMVRGLS